MRARNFSRRVIFFFPANSACAKLVWWIIPGSLENLRLAFCNKSTAERLNQRFPSSLSDFSFAGAKLLTGRSVERVCQPNS
jgi:hypothetical protein